MPYNPLRLIGFLTILGLPGMAFAAGQSFTDVPAQSPHYAAVEYLKEQGILQGYAVKTDSGEESFEFRLDQKVNRAEMIKIIVVNKAEDNATSLGVSGTAFVDVPLDSWFSPYVERAVEAKIIDGPSTQPRFKPEQPVTRAEALKMLLSAYGIDVKSNYGEISYPLAADSTSPDDWFYPYFRYGLTASAVQANENMLKPSAEMTRGDVAGLIYRFLLYRDGKQTQTLLSSTENDVLNALLLLENGVTDTAREAAARAVLTARGALSSRPDDAVSKAAVKTSEGVMALVDAQKNIDEGNTTAAVEQASTAWHLGAKAMEFSSGLKSIDLQLQTAATKMADRARSAN